MSKKQDDYYFDNFMKCAEYSCKAAYLLKEILTEFQPEEISKKMEEIHEIERQADTQRHEITDKLAKAFITPIEREDIIALSHHIDDVTDKIEEVLIRVYINNVQEMCQEVFLMLDVVIECCEELQTLLKEFKNFKHSKELKPSIIRMNTPSFFGRIKFLAYPSFTLTTSPFFPRAFTSCNKITFILYISFLYHLVDRYL